MGSQRLAAVAAVHTARHYNHTQTTHYQHEPTNLSGNAIFICVSLCGVLVALCATCWRRTTNDKPDDVTECRGVYTLSTDARLHQIQVEVNGPPPAYETLVDVGLPPELKDDTHVQVINSGSCDMCTHERSESGLPSYEAAVMLKDTRL